MFDQAHRDSGSGWDSLDAPWSGVQPTQGQQRGPVQPVQADDRSKDTAGLFGGLYGPAGAASSASKTEPPGRLFNRKFSKFLFGVRLRTGAADLYAGPGPGDGQPATPLGIRIKATRLAKDRVKDVDAGRKRGKVITIQANEAYLVWDEQGRLDIDNSFFYRWGQTGRGKKSAGFMRGSDIEETDRRKLYKKILERALGRGWKKIPAAERAKQVFDKGNRRLGADGLEAIPGLKWKPDPKPIRGLAIRGTNKEFTQQKPYTRGEFLVMTWNVPSDDAHDFLDGTVPPGAGMVRAVLTPKDDFYPCPVGRIETKPLFVKKRRDENVPVRKDGKTRGIMWWAFGYILRGEQRLYGWIVHSHDHGNGTHTNVTDANQSAQDAAIPTF